jgi:hypothetical protein
LCTWQLIFKEIKMAGPYDQGWNDALDEIARRAALLPFGKDTQESIAIWTKEAKRMPLNMTLEEQERWLWVEGEVGNATLLGKQIDLENKLEDME